MNEEKSQNSIRSLRKKAGLTRADMYKKFKIPVPSLRNWENENTNCPEYIRAYIEEQLTKEIMCAEIKFEKSTSDSDKIIVACYKHSEDNPLWSYPIENGKVSISLLQRLQQMSKDGWTIHFKDTEWFPSL